MKKRRPTWHAAARAAGERFSASTLRAWTQQKSDWNDPVPKKPGRGPMQPVRDRRAA